MQQAVLHAPGALTLPELSRRHYQQIRSLVYSVAGINLHEGKETLVRARLARRMRELGLTSFEAYLEHVSAAGSDEVPRMVDALTTNKTSFFREPQHFDCLRHRVLPPLIERGSSIRVWSAGCSSGEEPYTLAMVLRGELGVNGPDTRILATDISARMVDAARIGIYDEEDVADLPPALLRACFTRVAGTPPRFAAGDALRSMIRFARLNLMDEWPMRGPFDVIFCRNVMIYFDKPTQERLVGRFHEILAPGGYLFVGHSESLSGVNHGFSYVQPAVYVK